MNSLKVKLFSACALSVLGMNAAQAQVALPAVELDGAGASSIQNILVQSLNCTGNPGAGLNQLGTNTGSLSTIVAGLYQPTAPTAANPTFDCATQVIQPAFQGKYVATGSGAGRKFWSLFSNQLPGTTASNINPFGTWTNVQFAFSDAPVSAAEIATYNTNANSAVNKAGAAIQLPLYVLPVAVAYDPKYGTRGGLDLTFNVKSTFVTKDSAGAPTGGLHLSKAAYCKIFNGEITNWNNPVLNVLNGGNATTLTRTLMDADDSTARWDADGAPIRLVGRVDKSGTTDIFTRHLAATCTPFVTVNKFVKSSEALPYDPTSTINMTGFRSDSPYVPAAPTGNFSGNVQSLSGAFFNKTTQAIVTTQGVEAAGLFMVADGSSGVRDAVKFAPDLASPSEPTTLLNGKLGYIGADFVKPAPSAVLFSAALQVGAGTTYAGPTAANAVQAMGTGATAILPPQSVAASGAFATTDTRTNSVTAAAVSRANPLDWTDVLYSNAANTLANPAKGYAITGTTQFLGNTCYSTDAKRFGIVEFLSLNFGKVTKTSTNAPISANTFKGTGATSLGLLAKAGIAPLPASWQNAVYETFLKKSTQASGGTVLGNLNLWIQSKLPTTAAMVDATVTAADPQSNPTCTSGAGA
jgi:hypothetical protein